MCCHAHERTKDDFISRKKRGKTFVAWKVVRKDGRAIYGLHSYCPGTHTVEVTKDTYSELFPRGLHVYMNKGEAMAEKMGWGFIDAVLIPVRCHIDDLVMMSEKHFLQFQQAVMTKIKIREEDWVKAGLPIKKGE